MSRAFDDALRNEILVAADEVHEGKPGWKIESENPAALRTACYKTIQTLYQETGDLKFLNLSVILAANGEREVWIINKNEVKHGRHLQKYGVSEEKEIEEDFDPNL